MREFCAGQKVVCLWSEWQHVKLWHRILDRIFGRSFADPIKDGIYTISAIDGRYLVLAELIGEEAYDCSGFRPLESHAIQLFRKIAADATEKRRLTVRA